MVITRGKLQVLYITRQVTPMKRQLLSNDVLSGNINKLIHSPDTSQCREEGYSAKAQCSHC